MIRLSLKIFSIFCIFIFPIGYIINVYQSEPIETVTRSFDLIPMFLVIGIVAVGVSFLFSLLKSKIYNDPAGTVAILFYGIIMLAFGIVAWVILHSVIDGATQEFDVFIKNFELYRKTAVVLIASVLVGLFSLGANIFLNLKNKG